MLDKSGNPSAASPAATDHDAEAVTPMLARARWLMGISALTTLIAIAAVLGVIGYRIFHAGRSTGPPAAAAGGTIALPKGARVVSTSTAGDRIVVTVEVGGGTEILVFDANTLQATGQLRFATRP